MKKTLFVFVALIAMAACNSRQTTAPAADGASSEVAFEVAKNYFVKNNAEALPASPKLTSEEEFGKLFGMATTMGEDGKPTAIDFNKQFAVAIVLPVTDVATEITPVKVEEKGDSLFYTYEVTTGEKQSFSIQPASIIILDKKYEDKEIILINDQLMKKNMEEVEAYLKECGAFFIATNDGGIGMLKALGADGKALIVTKDVEPMVVRAANNIQGVKTTFVGSLNVVDILNCDKFIISQDAVKLVEEVYAE